MNIKTILNIAEDAYAVLAPADNIKFKCESYSFRCKDGDTLLHEGFKITTPYADSIGGGRILCKGDTPEIGKLLAIVPELIEILRRDNERQRC